MQAIFDKIETFGTLVQMETHWRFEVFDRANSENLSLSTGLCRSCRHKKKTSPLFASILPGLNEYLVDRAEVTGLKEPAGIGACGTSGV